MSKFLNVIKIIISSEGAGSIPAGIEIIRTSYDAMESSASKHKVQNVDPT